MRVDDAAPADVVEGQLAAIDPGFAPEHHPFLGDQLDVETALLHLRRDGLHHLGVLGIPSRGVVHLYVDAVRVSRLGQKFTGFLGVVRIALGVGVVADVLLPGGALHHETEAIEDVLDDGVGVHRIVGRLPHELVVPGLEPRVDGQEVDAPPGHGLDVDPRVPLQALHVVGRHRVDHVGLSGLQGRDPGGLLCDLAPHQGLDLRLRGAPVGVVALQDQVAVALEALELVGSGADGMLVHVLAVLRRGGLAHDEARLELVEKHDVARVRHQDDGVVVHDPHLHQLSQLPPLQAVLVRLDAVERELDVVGRQRRAVVELDSLLQLERPLLALQLPGLGQLGHVCPSRLVHLHQRLHDVLPDGVGRAQAVVVGVEGIDAAGVVDHHPVLGGGPGGAGDEQA